MSLHRTDVEHLRSVFMAVENGDIGMLKSLGIRVKIQISENPFFMSAIVGFRAWRRQVFPRETCQHRISRLIYVSISCNK